MIILDTGEYHFGGDIVVVLGKNLYHKSLTLLDLTKSPKQVARGVAQSPYPIYRHGKACLSKRPPWRAAGDPRLARGRSRVRAPGPVDALLALFFSTLPSFLLREIVFFAPSPPNPRVG